MGYRFGHIDKRRAQEAAEVTLTLTLTQILPLRRYCDVIGVCVRARALTHTHTRAHTLTHTHRLKLHFMGPRPSPLSRMAVVGHRALLTLIATIKNAAYFPLSANIKNARQNK